MLRISVEAHQKLFKYFWIVCDQTSICWSHTRHSCQSQHFMQKIPEIMRKKFSLNNLFLWKSKIVFSWNDWHTFMIYWTNIVFCQLFIHYFPYSHIINWCYSFDNFSTYTISIVAIRQVVFTFYLLLF